MNWVLFVVSTLLLCAAADPVANRRGTCGPTSKVTYSETVLPSQEIDDFQLSFVSDNNQIVFIRTTDGHIYRSGDEGQTWVKQTVPSIMEHIDDSTHKIDRMTHTEVDNTVSIYFLGGDGKLWVSQDNGVKYKYYDNVPSGVSWLKVHPRSPGLVLARRNVQGSLPGNELWLGDSTSSDMKWTKLADRIPYHSPISWSSRATKEADYTIFTMKYAEGSTNIHNCQLVRSNDWFKTVTKLPVTNVSTWYHMEPDKFVVITCTDITSCSSSRMQVSEDGGTTFSTAVFPDYRTATKEDRKSVV